MIAPNRNGIRAALISRTKRKSIESADINRRFQLDLNLQCLCPQQNEAIISRAYQLSQHESRRRLVLERAMRTKSSVFFAISRTARIGVKKAHLSDSSRHGFALFPRVIRSDKSRARNKEMFCRSTRELKTLLLSSTEIGAIRVIANAILMLRLRSEPSPHINHKNVASQTRNPIKSDGNFSFSLRVYLNEEE
jgi:hypothetical protein